MQVSRRILFLLLAVVLTTGTAWAQTEPEAPSEPEVLHNGWQVAFYAGLSFNYFSGWYDGLRDDCNCTFVSNGTSFSVPFGLSLNFPLWNDASIVLRGGIARSSTNFEDGRMDSLITTPGFGEVIDDLNLRLDLVQLDVLVRLIGRHDGERVYFGYGLGWVDRQDVVLKETEYGSNGRPIGEYLITKRSLEGGRAIRQSFIIGAEYAFVPTRNLYLIPAFELDYSLKKLSDVHPLRPSFYRLLITVSWQAF